MRDETLHASISDIDFVKLLFTNCLTLSIERLCGGEHSAVSGSHRLNPMRTGTAKMARQRRAVGWTQGSQRNWLTYATLCPWVLSLSAPTATLITGGVTALSEPNKRWKSSLTRRRWVVHWLIWAPSSTM